MAIAGAVSLRGDCTRRQVGAVIIGPKHEIVSIGYNGVAPGEPGCLDGACPRGLKTKEEIAPGSPYDAVDGWCIATHAEMNALTRADHERLAGSTMYITCEPCRECAKVAANTPLCQIIYSDNGELKCMFSDIQEWARRER